MKVWDASENDYYAMSAQLDRICTQLDKIDKICYFWQKDDNFNNKRNNLWQHLIVRFFILIEKYRSWNFLIIFNSLNRFFVSLENLVEAEKVWELNIIRKTINYQNPKQSK